MRPLTWGVNSAVDDGITFDIAAQIGALFNTDGVESPTHGLNVRHVFEAGFSQDGGFTFTQADVFNGLERLPNGEPVYDGYVPGGTTGPSNSDFGLTPAGSLPARDPRHQMQPRDVPVIQINTETEEALAAAKPHLPQARQRRARRPIPAVGGARCQSCFQRSRHARNHPATESRRAARDTRGGAGAGRLHPPAVRQRPFGRRPGVVDPNTYPFSNVANAAFADLTKWVDTGVPPPHADPIEVSNGTIVRDQFGNALGGVRTPFVDGPTTTYSPTDTVAHPTEFSGFCILYGFNTPFSPGTLRSLYGSHGNYVAAVARESTLLVREGFWLRTDAQQVIIQAAHADVP